MSQSEENITALNANDAKQLTNRLSLAPHYSF